MRKIAIVGVGPRGLSALECLCSEIAKKPEIPLPTIFLFEKEKTAGSGQVWGINQPEINWLNISQRALHELKGRAEINGADFYIPSFPSYIDWLPKKAKRSSKDEPDIFPPRSKMGLYLKKRFESIMTPLFKKNDLKLIQTNIIRTSYTGTTFTLHSEHSKFSDIDEVLLTIGHQSVSLSEQLKKWKTHDTNNDISELYIDPYPVERFINNVDINTKKNVAIRGFGLATIDVIRALTIGKGGNFVVKDERTLELEFKTNDCVPSKIIPFSLDGKQMVPKPLNGKIDQQYIPSEENLNCFKFQLQPFTTDETKVDTIDFLKQAIADIVSVQYLQLKNQVRYSFKSQSNLTQTIIKWLENEDFKHPSFYTDSDTISGIKNYNLMAVGDAKISLDYCIGQVWRHCQPTMYELFSHAQLDVDLMAQIISLDERMKRYAYGPPVESMQQLAALHKAGILSFKWANNPSVELIQQGWRLIAEGHNIDCSIMINGVLDSPQLLKVKTPLITNLLDDDLLQPIHSELGIKTQQNGIIQSKKGEKDIHLAILGRLCQGSVLGVDAILECFRLRIDDWAKGAVRRLTAQ